MPAVEFLNVGNLGGIPLKCFQMRSCFGNKQHAADISLSQTLLSLHAPISHLYFVAFCGTSRSKIKADGVLPCGLAADEETGMMPCRLGSPSKLGRVMKGNLGIHVVLDRYQSWKVCAFRASKHIHFDTEIFTVDK